MSAVAILYPFQRTGFPTADEIAETVVGACWVTGEKPDQLYVSEQPLDACLAACQFLEIAFPLASRASLRRLLNIPAAEAR